MAGIPFFGMFLALCCHFSFLTSLFVLRGCIHISVLSTVLLVVLEHPSTFLGAVICTVSGCFTNFAFPSHIPPAYSSFDTTTFIRIHVLILVSRCESDRIASILPTCAVPFPVTFCYVCIPRAVFRDIYAKVCMLVCDRQFIFSPLPFESHRAHLIFVTY